MLRTSDIFTADAAVELGGLEPSISGMKMSVNIKRPVRLLRAALAPLPTPPAYDGIVCKAVRIGSLVSTTRTRLMGAAGPI